MSKRKIARPNGEQIEEAVSALGGVVRTLVTILVTGGGHVTVGGGENANSSTRRGVCRVQ